MKAKGIVFDSERSLRTEPSATVLADVSRFANDLTLAGTADWVQLSSGLWVLTLDGDSDYASKNIANFRSQDSLGSVALWLKTSATSAQNLFVSADTAAATRVLFISLSTTNGYLRVYQREADAADDVNGDAVLNDGEWHFAVVISNGTAFALYTDAVSNGLTIASGFNNGDWFKETTLRDNFVFGALVQNTTSQYFNGSLALPRIYNCALSAGKIQQIFESERWMFGV